MDFSGALRAPCQSTSQPETSEIGVHIQEKSFRRRRESKKTFLNQSTSQIPKKNLFEEKSFAETPCISGMAVPAIPEFI